MYKVLIADDELIIRQGLKCILDWSDLGFEIVAEASNGKDALEGIRKYKPDLVLMDIRMPKMLGVDVVKTARSEGYKGKVIVLSGFTDFQYTQAAIEYGVNYYLTKPIDENELYEKVMLIKDELKSNRKDEEKINTYKDKAHGMILYDIMTGKADFDQIRELDMYPSGDCFQIVIYEKYSHKADRSSYKFADLLKVTNEDNNSYDYLHIDHNEVLLLKGRFIQKKFQSFLDRYEREQKPQLNSPLDSLFITYGRVVNKIEDIHISYEEALLLLQRRFFCDHHQHTIGYDKLPTGEDVGKIEPDEELLSTYCTRLTDYIQTGQKSRVAITFHELENLLYNSDSDISRIKLFMTDLFLSVKERIYHLYHNENLTFPTNSEIIDFIGTQYYLYEIILYFTEQFDSIMHSIGKSSGNNVIDDIINYIEHNYTESIKLENIAPLFGYNSSYLGKIFTKKVGIAFNSFIDEVRIRESKKLLEETDMKVYEVAEKTGYRNVDYFHTKFKKYVGQSPVEYRKQKKSEERLV